jgi:hypothetical protein
MMNPTAHQVPEYRAEKSSRSNEHYLQHLMFIPPARRKNKKPLLHQGEAGVINSPVANGLLANPIAIDSFVTSTADCPGLSRIQLQDSASANNPRP